MRVIRNTEQDSFLLITDYCRLRPVSLEKNSLQVLSSQDVVV